MGAIRLRVFVASFSLCLTVAGQEPLFLGKWETGVNPMSGKSAITVSIEDKELNGSVVVMNPDGTEMQLKFINPKLLNPKTLRFRTEDHGTVMEWHLFLKKNIMEALLRGSDRRPGKFGSSNGELLIEENLTKQK